MLAATVRVTRDLDLAEECVQEAYAAALDGWPGGGVPGSPVGWLTTTARRRAVDVVRRERVLRAKLPLLVVPEEAEVAVEPGVGDGADCVPDERLRLIFMCCHPALGQEAQLALTLRLVCGLSTGEVARALLVSEPTMAARLTRAKKKIATARIPYRVPEAADLAGRLRGVLGVIHLLFTAGHAAPSGASLMRADLLDQGVHLARVLNELMPGEGEVRGLLALLLVTDARRRTRVDSQGRLLRLDQQDRSQWDHAAIAEAHELLNEEPSRGRYVLQAAIAAQYAEAPTFAETDWARILALYDELLAAWPSPVVALNRTVALAEVAGVERALLAIAELETEGRLAGYQYLPAVKADLLRRAGRDAEAAVAYREALALTSNEAEREFLSSR
ncbi:RNA polymerase sigma factor [Winogradskya consettensis]|uniref:RNA polymerase subunit sigma-24 n=1 Tax=Winogradskya consettensis TaxID=113560 RepID=A0A919W0E9_9ACTN|nr:DUF6596 domain-containing protein [Actinoplanes consettensis]GIM81547.1 RNA polymerase subunit sigma-24 [Actinoplanes consettensis]